MVRSKKPRPPPARPRPSGPARLVALNKPFQVLCQFTDANGRTTLGDFVSVRDVYAAGRLDFDSEGLLLLTGHGGLIRAITAPRERLVKRYWVQVEGLVSDDALVALRRGVRLKDGPTAPAEAARIDEPAGLWPREPPIRERTASPTSWLDVGISEGRNRQVRRMTAAVGFPTLRLIRHAIGPWHLDGLAPGEVRELAFPTAWLAERTPASRQRPTAPKRAPGRPRGAPPPPRGRRRG